MIKGCLRMSGFAAAGLALAAMSAPAQAQFGRILGSAARAATTTSSASTSDGCSKGKSRSTGSRIAGGILGSLASSAAGSAGGILYYVPVASLTDQLTAAIACQLDPEEQQQAADATPRPKAAPRRLLPPPAAPRAAPPGSPGMPAAPPRDTRMALPSPRQRCRATTVKRSCAPRAHVYPHRP